MKVIITIDCRTQAFRGADCGNELARILRPLPDLLEFRSKSTIARRYGPKPRRLRDKHGTTVGRLKIVPEPAPDGPGVSDGQDEIGETTLSRADLARMFEQFSSISDDELDVFCTA